MLTYFRPGYDTRRAGCGVTSGSLLTKKIYYFLQMFSFLIFTPHTIINIVVLIIFSVLYVPQGGRGDICTRWFVAHELLKYR